MLLMVSVQLMTLPPFRHLPALAPLLIMTQAAFNHLSVIKEDSLSHPDVLRRHAYL